MIVEAAEYPIRVIKSNRRSVSIKVHRDLSLELRVPLRFKSSELPMLIRQYQDWIEKKRVEISSLPQPKECVFSSGETVSILGKNYPVVIEIGKRLHASFTGGSVVLVVKAGSTPDVIQKLGMKWYIGYAREVIESRVRHFMSLFPNSPNRISIKSMRTRWGSCSSARHLNFNWKLVMLPLPVLDYVVIHEMCHMLQMNHSAKFWAEVEKRDPNFKAHRLWLRHYSILI